MKPNMNSSPWQKSIGLVLQSCPSGAQALKQACLYRRWQHIVFSVFLCYIGSFALLYCMGRMWACCIGLYWMGRAEACWWLYGHCANTQASHDMDPGGSRGDQKLGEVYPVNMKSTLISEDQCCKLKAMPRSTLALEPLLCNGHQQKSIHTVRWMLVSLDNRQHLKWYCWWSHK